ncbi:MAG: hypothetical protein KA313_00275 [Pseudarcicella sp.]|nr:hypothetical protein [Pseudarcicella sp.]
MKKISLFAFLITFAWFSAKAQSDSEFKTKEKPKIDTTIKKNGILGKIVNPELLESAKKAKKIIEKPKEAFNTEKDKIIAKATDKTTELKKELGITDLGLKSATKKEKVKQKKTPKDEYEGIKIERRLGQNGTGNRKSLEEINVLKSDDYEPSVYAREVWWYDYKLGKIVNSAIKDKEYAQICHGPYKRYLNDELVEEGFFYLGAKHGRWEEYNSDYILLKKERYKYGFYADSHFSFYDKAETKYKEVIPKIYGKVTGDYRSFYEGGQLKEEGRMDDSVKVGRWREYHQFGTGGRLKKETLYGKDKFDKTLPSVVQERNNKGEVIYDGTKQTKKKEK